MYLEAQTDTDLEVVIPYDGALTHLHEGGLSLRYAFYRACTHHYYHIGEIAAKRDLLGHDVGEYPGLLEECI